MPKNPTPGPDCWVDSRVGKRLIRRERPWRRFWGVKRPGAIRRVRLLLRASSRTWVRFPLVIFRLLDSFLWTCVG